MHLSLSLAASPSQEFEVLEHLLRSGVASLVDTLAVEWHTTKRGQGGARATLQAREQRIVTQLERAGVRLTKWGDARAQ